MKSSFAIVGCGKVGTALGLFLTKRGYPAVGFASRSLSSAKKLADGLRVNCVSKSFWDATQHADIVFITTPDGAIENTCNQISQNSGFKKNAFVFHCSGALPSTILKSASSRCDAFIASMHPLQSYASATFNSNPFQNIIITVEGENEAVKTAEQIVKDLGAKFVKIATDGKILYHAAAVVASNYLITLINLSLTLMNKAEISGKDALHVLQPLIAGTLENIERVGIPEALTGPIARGDIHTVKAHLNALETISPEILKLYKLLGIYTVEIATAKGTLSKLSAQKLKNILQS